MQIIQQYTFLNISLFSKTFKRTCKSNCCFNFVNKGHTQPPPHTQKHYLKVKEPILGFLGKVSASFNSKSRSFLFYSYEDFPPSENGNFLILCMVNLIWMLHSFAFFRFVSSLSTFLFFKNMNVFWIFICCLFDIP